ncbi:hypothetical protein ACHAPJ_007541 [Fusarium lateritium]
MSGTEALAVLSAIATVISIVDGIKKLYDAASDAKGLPSAFRDVVNRLPLVHETLQTANKEVDAGGLNEATCKAMKKVVEACGTKAENLEIIFKKVLPEADSSRMDRYLVALKSLPKGSRVELLMKGILEDVQILTSNHGMKTVTKDELEKLTEAIEEMEKLPPSADDDSAGKSQSAIHHGQGDLYAAMENQYTAKDQSHLYHATNMTFSDDCLQSLSFSRLGYRQRSIQQALPGTCTWLPDHERYKAWINRDGIEEHFGLLWVKGGVGTGKSTLMNEAYLAAQEWPNEENKKVVAGYFAHRGGEPMERSDEGLIRTLLLQILPKHKIMMDDLVSIYKNRCSRQGTGWQWTAEELYAFMERHLVKSGGTAFYLFIDGLDEFDEEEARDLVSYFRKLTITASATGANTNVCLSSRYYPNISAPLCPEIMVETENEQDIKLVVNERLFAGRAVGQPTKDAYAKDIVEIASGAILWAILVVSQLNKDYDKGRSEAVMKSRLATNPRELNEMYTEIFKEVEEEERADVLQFWRCVVFAARPLKLTEFNHLFAFSADPPPDSLVEWRAGDSAYGDGDRLIRMVSALSRGLVAVRLKQPTVQKAETGSTAPLEVSGRFRLNPTELTDTGETAAGDRNASTNGQAQHRESADHVENQPSQQQNNQTYGQALFEALLNMVDWDQAINFHADLEVDAEALEAGFDSLWRTFLDAGYEVVPLDITDGNNWYLEFVHTSVRDFFTDKNAFQLICPQPERSSSTGQGHYSIAMACLAYIKMQELEPLAGLAEKHLTEMNFPHVDELINPRAFPLVGYAFRFFCHHARLAEEHGMAVDFLLSSPIPHGMIVTGKWEYLPGRPIQSEHHRLRTDCSDYGTRLRLLCGSGLFCTAEHYIKTEEGAKEVNAGDRLGKTPLYYVFERAKLFKSDEQMADFARFLLQYGADPNIRPDLWYDTLLEVTLRKHLDHSAECLIEGGAKINLKDNRGDPLTVLVARKPEDLDRVRWLLDKGARPVTHAPLWARFLLPALFGGLGTCALGEAARVASPQMVELLFEYVKTKAVGARDVEELVREAIGGKKYANLGVILATRQVRRVITGDVITLVRQMLTELDQQQPKESSEAGSQGAGRNPQEKDGKKIAGLVEELSKNAVRRRLVGMIRRGCCV